MYGVLHPHFIPGIKRAVEGKRVWDWGAGDGQIAKELLLFGASGVVLVDKHRIPSVRDSRIEFGQLWYYEAPFPEREDVCFVSWPTNGGLVGLVERLAASDTLVYVGLNDGDTMCGTRPLFEHMLHRRLICYEEGENNNLLILGKARKTKRKATPEEEAGLEAWGVKKKGEKSCV